MQCLNLLAGPSGHTALQGETQILRLMPDGDRRTLYLAELAPGRRIGAHYHRLGGELYYIVAGQGRLYTQEGGMIGCLRIGSGDLFRIEAGIAHQLFNDGERGLRLLFSCPAAHLHDDQVPVGDLARAPWETA